VTFGARISAGRVLYRIVGRRGESLRRAVSITEVVSDSVRNNRCYSGARSYSFRASVFVHPVACGHFEGPRSVHQIPCIPELARSMLQEEVSVVMRGARALSVCRDADVLVIVPESM